MQKLKVIKYPHFVLRFYCLILNDIPMCQTHNVCSSVLRWCSCLVSNCGQIVPIERYGFNSDEGIINVFSLRKSDFQIFNQQISSNRLTKKVTGTFLAHRHTATALTNMETATAFCLTCGRIKFGSNTY